MTATASVAAYSQNLLQKRTTVAASSSSEEEPKASNAKICKNKINPSESKKAKERPFVRDVFRLNRTDKNSKAGFSNKTNVLPFLKQSDNGRHTVVLSMPRISPLALLLPTTARRRKKIALISAIRPENERSQKERFMRSNHKYNPYFVYRYSLNRDILNKYSTPSETYLKQALHILLHTLRMYGTYESFEKATGGSILPRSKTLTCIQNYLKQEGLERDIVVNLSERLLSRGAMTRINGKLTLTVRTVNLREKWLDGLLRHEIGTHFYRSSNNIHQPWNDTKERRRRKLKPPNPTEEGLASLHSVIFREDPSLWRAALLYYTAYIATYVSFKDLFEDLEKFVKDPNVRWDYCIRAKRGQMDTSYPGAFCKDQVYLEGAMQLLHHRQHINFPLLVRLGKVAYEDMDKIKEAANVGPTRIPTFMFDRDRYMQNLDHIVKGNGLTNAMLH